MNKLIKNKNYNSNVFKLISWALTLPLLTNLASSFFTLLNISSNIPTYLIYTVFFIILLRFIMFQEKKVFAYTLIYLIVFILIMMVSYLIFPNTRVYYITNLTNLILIILFYIPILTFIIHVTSWEDFLNYQKWYVILSPILVSIFLIFTNIKEHANYMHLSNILLPGMLGSYLIYVKNKSNKYFVLFIIYLLIQLIIGSRGAIVSAVFMVIVLEIINFRLTPFTILKIVLVIMLIIIFDKVSYMIISLLNKYEVLDLRTIKLILDNNFFSSNSRDEIYTTSISVIQKMGLNIYGVFGDRVILNEYLSNVVYAHNIFLEFIFSFGLPIGILISILLIFKIVKNYFNSNDKNYIIVLTFFVSLSFIRLLVSGSFIIEGNFYLFIGILLNKHLNSNYKKIVD